MINSPRENDMTKNENPKALEKKSNIDKCESNYKNHFV